jgi:DNA-binding CsgD family transcriptional regulator
VLKSLDSEKPWVNAMEKNHDHLLPNLKRLQSTLIESVREGILLISGKLQPIYLNLKAKELAEQLWNGNPQFTQLPPVLSNISHQLFQSLSPEDEPLIMDYQINSEQTIRIRACQFAYRFDQDERKLADEEPYILVFLEDRNAARAEELKLEQKKYDLTDRETQILRLILQAYSYQDIAEILQISLNTVKFHIKNIRFKKRNYLEQDRN